MQFLCAKLRTDSRSTPDKGCHDMIALIIGHTRRSRRQITDHSDVILARAGRFSQIRADQINAADREQTVDDRAESGR